MNVMKALTIWQPWATLIAIGAKQYETRSWSTEYRGLLAIHAAKRPIMLRELNREILTTLEQRDQSLDQLPLGSVLAVARLIDVVPVEQVVTLAATDQRIANEELYFVNYAPGRYAWKLELVRVAPEPVPAQGAQGLWNWSYD